MKKAGVVLVGLLCAAGFGAGGVIGGSELARHVGGWWTARTWQPVSGTVIETALQADHTDGVTYRAAVRYRYEVRGKTYDGDRVGFTDGFDNIDGWQREHFNRFRRAKRLGQSITVWVDPAHPEHSIADRQIRWNMLVFAIPFAVLFSLISIGAVWFTIKAICTPSSEISAPSLGGNARTIESDTKRGLISIWFMTVFWNLVSLPLSFIFIQGLSGRTWYLILVLVFPFLGMFLLWTAVKATLDRLRNGAVTIELNPTQPTIGRSVTIHATLDRVPPPSEFVVSLQCEKVDDRGDSTKIVKLWGQDQRTHNMDSLLVCTFLIPHEFPASQPADGIYHRWRVVLRFPDGEDERSFDIVVGRNPDLPARAGAEPMQIGGVEHPVIGPAAPTLVAASADAAEEPGNADALKIRRWVVFGANAGAVVMILLFAWHFVSTFLAAGDRKAAVDSLGPEALSREASIDPRQSLFSAAVQRQSAASIAEAIENGAAVDATNAVGFTPLLFAVNGENVEGVKELISRGANVNFSVSMNNDLRGRTALMNAANQENNEIIKVLLAAGANPHTFERHGWSPLHYAARRDNLDSLRLFHRYGIDLNLRAPECECRGETPLMIAARFGNVATIKELIKLGADPEVQDRYGENAYGWAKFFKQRDAQNVLKAYARTPGGAGVAGHLDGVERTS